MNPRRTALWKRYWWLPVLMLSLGVNVGLVTGRLGSEPARGASDPIEAETPTVPSTEPSARSGPRHTDPQPERFRRDLPRPVHRALLRLAADFGLEGASSERFMDIQREFFRRSQDGRARLHRARADLRQELLSDAPDRQRAEAVVRRMSAAQQDMEGAFVDNYFQTRELLGPGQEQRFLRFMARIREARRDLAEARGRRR